ncbi:MAG: arylsulfatase [Verrucomicrobia bacterium]|jgi:arylsulfatase A|nr:arylsulfatase [Verrucomicrobiota bacterium]
MKFAIATCQIRLKWVIPFLIACILQGTIQADSPPNLIFILADDMGYGDVRAYNPQSKIPTPHLDRLAGEGMRFTDAHTPSAVCTPTRYGFLTGRYCWRSRLKRGVLNGYSDHLIQEDRLTLPRFLKGHGYQTGVVGKWHLGLDFHRLTEHEDIDYSKPVRWGPNDFGFEYSYIIPASLDFPPYVYLENQLVTGIPAKRQPKQSFPAFLRAGPIGSDFIMEDCLDQLASKAVGFLERISKSENPFFLYMPLTAPHKPVLPHPRFKGQTQLGVYGDFIVQCDAIVGRVLEALDTLELKSNTMVVFTSDNGSFMRRLNESNVEDHVDDESIQAYRADRHTSNGLLRGTKADVWEAGHRVPFIVRFPGEVEAGSVCEQMICLTDYYATAAQLIDRELPVQSAEDSISFLPLLKEPDKNHRRPPVIHHSGGGMFAIRDGRWKLVLGNGSGGREAPRGKVFEKPFALFDLKADVAENANLIKERPEVAELLEGQFWRIHERGHSR